MANGERSEIYGIPIQFVVPATPVLGYGYAFLFASGRASYFKIPVDLIALDLTSVVHATIILIGILVLTLFFAGSYALNLSRGSQHLPSWLNRYLHHLALPLLIAVFFGLLSGTLIPTTSAMLLALLVAASWALIRTLAERESKESTPRQEQINAIARRLRREHITVAWFLLLLAIVTYAAGAAQAQSQETFKVNAANHDQVLLAIYSHHVGVFGYVDNKQRLSGQLTILKLDDDPTLVLLPRTFPHGIKVTADK